MIRFNRKKFISSLAASAIIATATLAPLPGLLATVHAAPTTPYVQINNPAHINEDGGTGSNGVVVTLTYNCTTTPASTATDVEVSVTQTTAQSGTGVAGSADTGGNGPNATTVGTPVSVNCTGGAHQVDATIFPTIPLNAGTASITATLQDTTGTTVGTATTAIVRLV